MGQMPLPPKRGRTTRGSIASLAEIYFSAGPQGAREAFHDLAPDAVLRPYHVVKAGQGQPSVRTDVSPSDKIFYEFFGPPELWASPYWVARVRFDQAPKPDFISHAGEELLIPTSGGISYHFFWANE